MDRYSVINTKMPREFLLLQGMGCRWRQCTFCDYHKDVCNNPFDENRKVLELVTGVHGVLDVINSGSAMELDEETLNLLRHVVMERDIHTLWFEAHYMYRKQLEKFAAFFAPVTVKFRCGIESFSPLMRKRWRKGVPENVTPEDVARYFSGVCLLCCVQGDTRERIINDIEIARKYFEYFSVNVFCNNATDVKRDDELATWFEKELYPGLSELQGVEVLLNNTDLGVG